MGVAALLLVGAVAGFIVAEPAASREYRTVETVGSESNAYAVDLPTEKRMRFVLDADEDRSPQADAPEARFSVYDPQDAHFASFHLEGDGDAATVLADQAGSWVLFVTEAERGDLAVQVEGEDEGSEQVRSLEVDERSWEVAQAAGESITRDLALRLDQRPAQAFLDVDGQVEDLDASAVSDEGVVHAYEGVDSTDQGTLVNGSQRVEPGNLARGTYEISLDAEHLDGTVAFVAETYERPEMEAVEPSSEPGNESNATEPEAPSKGAEVASLTDGEAAEVAAQGADQLAFEVADDIRGEVYLYNASGDLLETVSLGDQERDRHDREDNHSRDRSTVAVDPQRSYSVYVAYLDGRDGWDDDEEDHGHEVTVRLPSLEEAESATRLSVEKTKVTVDPEEDNGTASVTLNGSLARVSAHSDGWSWESDDVTVEGPRGVVLESTDEEHWRHGWGHSYETYPERYTDGTFTVTVEDDGFQFRERETHVTFRYLVE